MKYRITHKTLYSYSEPVSTCRNEACLLPRDSHQQRCLTSRLEIDPAPADLRERLDFFGNRVSHFAIQQPHKRLQVTATSEIETFPASPDLEAANKLSLNEIRQLIKREKTPETLGALPFLYSSPMIPGSRELVDYARPCFDDQRPLGGAVKELMQRIYQDFSYDPGFTTIATPLNEVLANRRGVCQDFAHLAIGCLRGIGLAARYVSGYLETLPPPGQPKLVGADASHAWFSVYFGPVGWIDFDPTNNKLPDQQHITLGWGRDYSDVTPLKGVALGGGTHRVGVSVDVSRLSE